MTSSTTRRHKKRPWLLPVGLLLLLLVGGGVAFTIARGSDTPELPRTVAVTRGNLTMRVSGSGTVAAEQTLDVPFEASGHIETVLVEEGDMVETAQVLSRMETRELELAVADAKAHDAPAGGEVGGWVCGVRLHRRACLPSDTSPSSPYSENEEATPRVAAVPLQCPVQCQSLPQTP